MERLTEKIDNVTDGESGVWVNEHGNMNIKYQA